MATDPKTRGRWRVGLPKVDFAEEALNREQAAYAKQWPDADMSSLVWNVDHVGPYPHQPQ